MNDKNPTTDGTQPVGTDGNPPAAIPPQGQPSATDDDKVTISQADYKNLIAARDRSNNESKDLQDSVAFLEARQAEADKKAFLSDWLESNKKDYPDLTVDDLMAVNDPEKITEVAQARQRRYEDVVQEKLKNVQRATPPALSPEDRAAELSKLKENPGSGAFQRMLDLQSGA